MNDQMFDSLNRKVTEFNRKLESLMTNANKQIAMILALSWRATLGMFQWKGRHHGFGVGSSSGPGPRARAGMGPVGGARGSPRGPVEPASPRSPARSSTVQYFVARSSAL